MEGMQLDRLDFVDVGAVGELGSERAARNSDEEIVPLDVDYTKNSIAVR